MALGNISNLREIAGINLDDYFPQKQTYNSIVYLHKKFLPKHKGNNNVQRQDEMCNSGEMTVKNKKKKKDKVDKSSQVNNDITYTAHSKQRVMKNDSILEQTIRFARNIAPIAIPTSNNNTTPPVFYTIKTSKSAKKSHRHTNENKHRSKSTNTEFFKKDIYKNHEESITIRESVSHSSKNCTIDEINLNQSLCCSLSEISEKNAKKIDHKKEKRNKCNVRDVVPSESLEAIAKDIANACGDTKIKIHLMNDIDKKLLAESIRIPVVNAIKECILDLNRSKDVKSELKIMQSELKYNTHKLDDINERLSSIERKLEQVHTGKSIITIKSPKRKATSKLEEIGADLIEEENESSTTQGEVSVNEEYLRNKSDIANCRVPIMTNDSVEVMNVDERNDFGYDEPSQARTTVVKNDYGNKIPTRFCWTDSRND